MKNLRIVVYSARFGDGHIKAAEAIRDTVHKMEPHAEIFHYDFGDFINKHFYLLLKRTYVGLIKYVPKLWGEFYHATAKISPDSAVQKFLDNLGRERLIKQINQLKPDIIITTYPTVAGALGKLKSEKKLSVPVVTVITDYAVHSQWIHEGVDLYIVGCPDVSRGLVKRGINASRIVVTGIPVNLKFEKKLNKKNILEKLNLSPNRKTILIMGGAYGVLDCIKDICRFIGNDLEDVQAIVVCGKDEKLYESLGEIVVDGQNKILRLGYVNNVEELMTVADLMVSKAGGLIVSEALTKQVPFLVFNPIPGQEQLNTIFLNKVGAGKLATSLEELKSLIKSLMHNSLELENMQRAAAKAIPGNAAEQAVEYILGLVKEKKENEVKTG